MASNLHKVRRITQVLFILFILLAPYFDVFRFDSDAGRLIVFGNEWSIGLSEGLYQDPSLENASHVAWRFFLKGILPWIVILSIFPILGVFTGRFFCGWFCPEGALFELFDLLTMRLFGRRSLFTARPNDPGMHAENRIPYVIFSLFCMTVIPLIFGVALTGYFVDPATIWNQIMNWQFTFGVKAGIIGVSIYVFISSMIVRHSLCKYVCSAGLMQMLFGWASPVSLRIKTDLVKLAECTDCKKCEKVCFMNVKPRILRRDINCVNCGECISACTEELGKEKCIFSFAKTKNCALPDRHSSRKPDGPGMPDANDIHASLNGISRKTGGSN